MAPNDTQFRVVAVSLLPQCVVIIFSAQWAFSIFECNIYTHRPECTSMLHCTHTYYLVS